MKWLCPSCRKDAPDRSVLMAVGMAMGFHVDTLRLVAEQGQ